MKRSLIIWLCLLLVSLSSTGCVINNYESMLFLEDLTAGSSSSRLKKSTSQPEISTISFTVEGRAYQGDLYNPVAPSALAKIVLIPGITRQGKDDLRFVNFATTLARARFLVLVPEIPGMRKLKVRPSDAQIIADTFTHLISDNSLLPALPNAPTGIGAFSYAVGPAMLAAMRASISNRVDFIISVGGYYDLDQVLTFFTTGYYLKDGKWHHMPPNSYGKWVFISSNLERIQDSQDREAFRVMAERKMASPGAPIDDLITDLGSEGRSLYALISNSQPEQTPKMIKNLPERIVKDLHILNLANKNLAKLKAHLLLIHGKDDNIIPYTESMALAKNLPSDQTTLFLVTGISHVDIKPGLLDKWRLLKTANAILKQRVKE